MERYKDYLVDIDTQRIYNLDGSEVTYHMVCGYLGFSIENIRVHRVIAYLCVPNDDPENKRDVHHIDGNKLNNRPDNLVWMSRSEHLRYHANNRSTETIEKIRAASTGVKRTNDSIEKQIKSRTKPVVLLNEDGEILTYFENGTNEVASLFNIDRSNITRCCLGQSKTSCGRKFRYATQEEISEYNSKQYTNNGQQSE